jgi:hypothetical protein
MLTYAKKEHFPYDIPGDFFTYQPWFEEPGYLEGLSPRATVYFNQFIDKYKNFWSSVANPEIYKR